VSATKVNFVRRESQANVVGVDAIPDRWRPAWRAVDPNGGRVALSPQESTFSERNAAISA